MDEEKAQYDSAILRYMQPEKMTPPQYTNDLIAKSCKVADVFDKKTLKNVFIEGDEASIRYIMRHYWAQKPKADLSDFAY